MSQVMNHFGHFGQMRKHPLPAGMLMVDKILDHFNLHSEGRPKQLAYYINHRQGAPVAKYETHLTWHYRLLTQWQR